MKRIVQLLCRHTLAAYPLSICCALCIFYFLMPAMASAQSYEEIVTFIFNAHKGQTARAAASYTMREKPPAEKNVDEPEGPPV